MLEHLDSFPLKWRLCGEKYEPPPAEALEAVWHITDIELSRRLWASLAVPKGRHLMEALDLIFSDDPSICKDIAGEIWTDSNVPYDLPKILQPYGAVASEPWTPIVLFWREDVSMVMHWRIFERYWHNFFYPSDDSAVVAFLDRSVNLYIIESRLFLVDRSALFNRYHLLEATGSVENEPIHD
jgi:hypothetical protein